MNLGKQIEEQIEKAMNLNKQVDDMARDLCGDDADCNKCAELMPCFSRHFSKRAVAKGYRKSTELAREIFEEVEKYNRPPLPECEPVYVLRKRELDELKKKFDCEV